MLDMEVSFSGADGAEAERFVTAVRRRAFAEGKTKDAVWMADYASTRLEREAVRWFETLHEDVQEDWKLLRRALLERWPAQRF